jgi:hypothetical protein
MQSIPRWADNIWRKLVFFSGDIRTLSAFPWVTWADHEHLVDFAELMEALPLIRYGDVGLHRDKGYFSNLAIPGFLKHAWVHTVDWRDSPITPNPTIVEAVSEGVLKRSAFYPMLSDYVIILAPKNVTEEDRKGACVKANEIVGNQYDIYFEFDIEKELQYYQGKQTEEASKDLEQGQQWLQNYDHGFSCTEVASFCWWHKREALRLYRSLHRGKNVILADTFLNGGWEIRWMSQSVTVDVARKMGLHEEGLAMIEKYRR